MSQTPVVVGFTLRPGWSAEQFWADSLTAMTDVGIFSAPNYVEHFRTADALAASVEILMRELELSFDQAILAVHHDPDFQSANDHFTCSGQFKFTVYSILGQYWAYSEQLACWRSSPEGVSLSDSFTL